MNKKEAILSAALQLLTERGIHATPMSAIAKAAGTGMGTIYNYFPNKELLINELYQSIKQQEKQLLVDLEQRAPKAVKLHLRASYYAMAGFFQQNPAYFQLLQQLQASPIITAESKALGYQAINSIQALLERGQTEALIKPFPEATLLEFVGGTLWSYLKTYFDQKETADQILEHYFQLTWDAIKA